jgi:hypothetical protein
MERESIWRRLRGAVGNAVVWGAAWAGSAVVVFTALRIAGVIPQGHVLDALIPAVRFGFVGAIASVAFSGIVRLLYRGRRLSEISWVRFGVGGAVVGGLFVTAFLTTARLLSGDAMLPLQTLLTNGLLAAGFGGVAAAGSLKLAQRADRLFRGASHDGLERFEDVDRLEAGEPAAETIAQRSRATQRSDTR